MKEDRIKRNEKNQLRISKCPLWTDESSRTIDVSLGRSGE